MTLPNSGPLSLTDIKGEFGGNVPTSLNDYYAGGSFVPPGTSGVNGAVPSSGALSMSKFYGTSKFVPFTQTFTGGQSGSTTVPTGATGVRRILVGGGGYGGSGFFDVSSGDFWGGGGGGSGGVSDSGTVSVSSGEWGATINYSVGQAGRNVSGNIATGSALSGHYSDSAGGGGIGGAASGPGVPGIGGTAGSPSGHAGSTGGVNAGGAPGTGFTFFATQYGGGTTGQAGSFPGDGEDGGIILVWT